MLYIFHTNSGIHLREITTRKSIWQVSKKNVISLGGGGLWLTLDPETQIREGRLMGVLVTTIPCTGTLALLDGPTNDERHQ